MEHIVDTLQPGERLGPFEVLHPLHRGGQAVVYLARLWQPDLLPMQKLLRQLDRHHAIPELIEQQKLCVLKVAEYDQKDYLLNEWEYLSRPQVKHDRLIKTFSQRFPDAFSTRSRRQGDMSFVALADRAGNSIQVPYIALAYEPGGSLKQELERRNHKPLPPGCAVQIVLQVGEALQHLHEKARLVHHDISPSNILLRKSGPPFLPWQPDAILIDLAATESLESPRLRHIYGKRGYLPPERRRAGAKISPQIDIYSLGMVLYELLAGRLPDTTTTSGRSPSSVRRLQPVRELNPRVSVELNDLVMQSIDPDPTLREQHVPSMRQMLNRLQQVPEAAQPSALPGSWSLATAGALVGRAAVVLLIIVMVLLGGTYAFNAVTSASSPTATIGPTLTNIPTQTQTLTIAPTAKIPTSTPYPGNALQPGGLSSTATATNSPQVSTATTAAQPDRSSFMPVTPTATTSSTLISAADARH